MKLPISIALLSLAVAAIADPAVPPLRVIPKITFTVADLKAQTPRSKDGNFMLEIPEIVNLGLTDESRAVFAGKPVETTGQVVSELATNPDGRRLRIVRSLINCCAAHARPYSVIIEFAGKAPEFKVMTWVKVAGTMTYKVEDGNTTPVVAVTEMKEITAPVNPMLK
jgi:uncharacterized membrane protein YcgQ (UPF0703/DUF1980 family)